MSLTRQELNEKEYQRRASCTQILPHTDTAAAAITTYVFRPSLTQSSRGSVPLKEVPTTHRTHELTDKDCKSSLSHHRANVHFWELLLIAGVVKIN